VFDLLEMEDDARRELLGLSEPALADVARWANRYPDVSLSHELATPPEELRAGEPVSLVVSLEREGLGEGAELRPVDAPRFPGRKGEAWWLVVGDPSTNALLAIKRVTLQASCWWGGGWADGRAIVRGGSSSMGGRAGGRRSSSCGMGGRVAATYPRLLEGRGSHAAPPLPIANRLPLPLTPAHSAHPHPPHCRSARPRSSSSSWPLRPLAALR
jgi:hypothetical protein